VIEGARLWLEIGHYNPRRNNQFCISEVTGPDEYTALVDNNFYTNLMACTHLEYACEVYQWLREHEPEAASELAGRIGLDPTEPQDWRRAADTMFLPEDEALGIFPQDDSFLGKPEWDFDNAPAEYYPLLLNYHPLVIYRHQVCKQEDVQLSLVHIDNQIGARAVIPTEIPIGIEVGELEAGVHTEECAHIVGESPVHRGGIKS
jgi:alpha,alpha-trehalose phosphorylase